MDGIRFSGIGVCANEIMSHVSVLLWKRAVLFEKGWWFDLSAALIGLHVHCALGVEKRVLPKKPGAWFLGFDFFSQGRNQMLIISISHVPGGTVLKTLCG